MKINRENYEQWMIDYFEGNLNAFERCMVHDFLENNPDLKEEIEDLATPVLHPSGNDIFENKLTLKKNTIEVDGLSRHDYLCIRKTEGELTGAEKEEYEVFLKTHAGAKHEQKLYHNTILKPEKGIVYLDKLKLKRVTILPFISKDTFNKAAAIVILILLSSSLWMIFKPQTNRPENNIAKLQTKQSVSIQAGEKQQAAPEGNGVTTETEEVRQSVSQETVVPNEPVKIQQSVTEQTFAELTPLSTKGIDSVIKPVKVNGYEIAVNEIMPLYLSYLQNNEQKNKIRQEPAGPADNKNILLSGGLKMVNMLTGNSLKLKRKYDENGELIAYRITSPNISIAHKIKRENQK